MRSTPDLAAVALVVLVDLQFGDSEESTSISSSRPTSSVSSSTSSSSTPTDGAPGVPVLTALVVRTVVVPFL
uniref:Putative secreted protein n=1 Tax=Anopheles darlingi TaxID=43151 RepID=A0A2M4D7U5_ANODA